MQNENPLVSIIVPCYNQGEFLAETLDSVLAQTYTNWECIIINDGSTDNTEKIALQYTQKDKRYKYIFQSNEGVSKARNIAIANSCGEYILPLDGDDIIASSYIDKALSALSIHPELKLVYCRAELFGAQHGEFKLDPYNYDKLIWRNSIFVSAIFRRSDYDKTNGYNSNMKSGLEDWDFWLSFLSPNDIVYQIDEVLFFYRIKENSRNMSASMYEMELIKQIFRNHPDIYSPYIDNIIYYHNKINEIPQLIAAEVFLKEKEIRMSKTYRVGKAILKPFSWFKKRIVKT